ncbi:MAG: S8 family serine peptidase, partial [Crocinitomicaceae bacterium]|nr:S8 family serine peptidase [Crocinitomicaceae bacterium]
VKKAIEWAWKDQNSDIISCSWRLTSPSGRVKRAIRKAKEKGRNGKGCVILFAAGNWDQPVEYPAELNDVIAVGGVDMKDEWIGSGNGPELDVVAPGLAVYTTDREGVQGYNTGAGGALDLYWMDDAEPNYVPFRGTSAATPFAAGVCALILSQNNELTSDQVQMILEDSAHDVNDPGFDNRTGHGRVDAYEALQVARVCGMVEDQEELYVTGDFDNDGYEDDIVGFYQFESLEADMNVFLSNGMSFPIPKEWYTSGVGNFDVTKFDGRVVSGDFDQDGFNDDIMIFYEYTLPVRTKAWLWFSDGTKFSTPVSWYDSGDGNFDALKIKGTVVSGDFDNDGYEDDVIALYGEPTFRTRAFIWRSTGSGLTTPVSWYDSGVGNFDASKIRGRVASGDFDNDGFKDDLMAFYEYTVPVRTKAFVWKSTGMGLESIETWYDSGDGNFAANKIKGRVVSGDFDNDGFKDDVAAIYDYGYSHMRIFVWKAQGTCPTTCTFSLPQEWYNSGIGNYDAERVYGRVVSGDFDQDGITDMANIYKYDYLNASKIFMFPSITNDFGVPQTWWEKDCGDIITKSANSNSEKEMEDQKSGFLVYPNPTSAILNIKYELEMGKNGELVVFNLLGRKVQSIQLLNDQNRIQIDVGHLNTGTYIYSYIVDGIQRNNGKFVVQ